MPMPSSENEVKEKKVSFSSIVIELVKINGMLQLILNQMTIIASNIAERG